MAWERSPHDSGLSQEVTQASVSRAMSGLCEARDYIALGDFAAGRRVFLDLSHQLLHDVAFQAGFVDREATLQLLQAKYQVEQLLALPTGVGGVAPPANTRPPAEGDAEMLMSQLIDAFIVASDRVGLSVGSCSLEDAS